MKEAKSLGESTAAAPKHLLTTAEQSAYVNTGSYAEAVDLYRKLEKSSPYARLTPIGKSGEGRDLYLFVASKDKAFTAEAARKTGKPVVFLQNGIHAGENGGKDAAIMLLRDVLATKKFAAWLDHAIILSIPVFNVDGHEHVSPYNRINENGPAEMGFRVTAQRLNLNRDYIKADAPEMRAWLKVYTAWLPDFLIDNHVTDGSDYQWDVTIATHTEQDIAAPVGRWVNDTYLPRLMAGMEKHGHLAGWYIEGRGSAGLPVMTASPRYSTGYAAAQNRAALLVETHSLKSFRTRVWSHYDIMRVTLDIVAANARALKDASRAADALMASLKPGDKLFLQGRPGTRTEPYSQRLLESERYTGDAAGGPVTRYLAKPVDRPAELNRSLVPAIEVPVPFGYVVPRQWREIIELLRTHGVQMEPLPKETRGKFETYRFANVRFADRPFEGRFQVSGFELTPVEQTRILPAGSMFVPMNQRASRLIAHILEPQAPDSAARWGFLHGIFEQKEYFSDYIFEPIAASMLKRDAALKAEFEKKLAEDPAFAKNPRARLTWLFQRSPYYEQDKDAYPIVKVRQRPW